MMKDDGNRPVIGVNCDVELDVNGRMRGTVLLNYSEGIWNAGGIPLLIPNLTDDGSHLDTYLDRIDGLLLVGGTDYHPELYQEPADSHTELTRVRDHLDVMLEQRAEARGLPVLGICAGCQLIAIAHGGKLHQHLPQAEQTHVKTVHQATMLVEGFCSRLMGVKPGEQFEVASFHHQCVDMERLGQGLRVTAKAYDGTCEIIEGTGKLFVLGVQFHPERMPLVSPLFFQGLVEAARTARNCREGRG